MLYNFDMHAIVKELQGEVKKILYKIELTIL